MKIRENLKIALLSIVILWIVFFIDILLPIDLLIHGIRPRQLSGLWGIVFAPFLHMNFRHLMANSGTLLVLLTVSLSYSRRLTVGALFIIAIVGGGCVWLLGGDRTVHVGASGIIMGLIGFMFFNGFFRREWKALVFSLVIFLCYGGVLVSLLIYIPGVSWTGHFFGFLSGILAAWLTRRNSPILVASRSCYR